MRHFTSLVNPKFSRTVKSKLLKTSKQQLTLYTNVSQLLSNSQILVFYSEQQHVIITGYATNWNSTGYFEVFDQESKYIVKFWTNNVTVSHSQ